MFYTAYMSDVDGENLINFDKYPDIPREPKASLHQVKRTSAPGYDTDTSQPIPPSTHTTIVGRDPVGEFQLSGRRMLGSTYDSFAAKRDAGIEQLLYDGRSGKTWQGKITQFEGDYEEPLPYLVWEMVFEVYEEVI